MRRLGTTSGGPPGRVLGVALTLALTVLATGGGWLASAGSQVAAAGPSCRHATGPFHVSGIQVLDGAGNPFVPYGITVPGLSGGNWQSRVAVDRQKIDASAGSWCANTARLQVGQNNLVGPNGSGFSTAFMTAIEFEVSRAENDGLVVVINDQTESDNVAYQDGPTAGTEAFWKHIIKVYGQDRQVVFDLFNEPRTYSQGMSEAQEWSLWRDGGTFDGATYIGMAKLAADVRAGAGGTLFWVEGPDYSASFAGMERQHAVLTAPGIVYAVHHPAGTHDTAAWYDDFGYLINTRVAPVVDGEWTNYRPFPNANQECWSDAPARVPEYLSYLAGHGVGMTAYQLAPGLLVKPGGSLGDPTTIASKTWTCAPAPGPTDQGAGALIMAWYRAHNG